MRFSTNIEAKSVKTT